MKRFAHAQIVIFCLLATSVLADNSTDCFDLMTQQEVNACTIADARIADSELNEIYQIAINQWLGGRDTPRGQALLTAQRAWLIYRDAHCAAARLEFEGGSAQPQVFASCMAGITRARTEAIRRYARPL